LSESSADKVSDTADSNDNGDEHNSEGRSVGGQVFAELSSCNLSENLVVHGGHVKSVPEGKEDNLNVSGQRHVHDSQSSDELEGVVELPSAG